MRISPINRVIDHLRRAVLLPEDAELGDGELLDRFIESHDEAAFAVLVKRHGPMVWGVCRRLLHQHDAEDAFQATFLVLARKAASIRSKEMAGNWLYGVAHQTALQARRTTARRRAKEVQVTKMPDTEAVESNVWADLQPVLDEELSRLPDIYRAVIVLCDLEGLTRKEVARRLGVPEGTVAGRMARARTMLAKRLTQRGVTLSGGMLATVLAQNVTSAGVPTLVVSNTIKAASLMAAGQAAMGLIPTKVAALTEGMVKTMFVSNIKTAISVVLILTFMGTGATLLTYSTAVGQDATRKNGLPSHPAMLAEQLSGGNTDTGTTKANGLPGVPKFAGEREYLIKTKLVEAGADQKQEFVKITLGEMELMTLHISDDPQNLLAKVIDDEKIMTGTLLTVRVKQLKGNTARLFLSFQRNEVEKASLNEIRVLGSSVQTIQDVELRKPAKIEFQKDSKGSPQRWVELTVEEFLVDGEKLIPTPAEVEPLRSAKTKVQDPKPNEKVIPAPATPADPATPAEKPSPKVAKKEPVMLTPDEAMRLAEGKKATVEFKVEYVTKSILVKTDGGKDARWVTGHGPDDKRLRPKAPKEKVKANFEAILTEKAIKQLNRAGITDVERHFQSKTVRVTGEISRRRYDGFGTPPVAEVVVSDLNQLEVVDR